MKDYIKEELNTLREYLRISFLFLLAIITGIVTNFYQVISHSKPLYTLLFSVFGLPLLIVNLLIIKRFLNSIADKLNKLKDLK